VPALLREVQQLHTGSAVGSENEESHGTRTGRAPVV
jgi:hypothetical protein